MGQETQSLVRNYIGEVYSSKNFTWVKEQNAFVSEISMVPRVLRQLRVDEFDVGFIMRSEKTGATAAFIINSVPHGGDGDITSWIFVPTTEAIEKNPKLQNVRVIVYNT